MPATVMAERIGWARSMTVLKNRVQQLRLTFLPATAVVPTRGSGLAHDVCPG
jgi:hypothetical protein